MQEFVKSLEAIIADLFPKPAPAIVPVEPKE